MKRSIFSILICCCVLFVFTRLAFAYPTSCTVDGNTWTFLFVRSYDCINDLNADVAASNKSQTYNYGGSPVSGNAVVNGCLGIPDGSYVVLKYNVSYIDYEVYYLPPDAAGCPDSDGDGIPDYQDPCPQNPHPDCIDPDGDGDGIPDGQDPCPQNPNPNCTDPDNPPPDIPPPDIPDDIIIGPCTVDISSLKAWILSEDSFPFNFIYRIYSITSPLFDLTPSPPIFDIQLPLDPSSKYSFVPDTYTIHFDLTQFDFIASMLRHIQILGLCFAFAVYGMKRFRNFAGSGD